MGKLIQIIEPQHDIAHIIDNSLAKLGYNTEHFLRGKDFLRISNAQQPAVIIIDFSVPDISIEELVLEIRKKHPIGKCFVIGISDANNEKEIVRAFGLGIDDCIRKPIQLNTLICKINAEVRRNTIGEEIVRGYYTLNTVTRILSRGIKSVVLSSDETFVLKLLMTMLNTTVSRNQIQRMLWGIDSEMQSRAIDMMINRLRKKIESLNDASFHRYAKDVIETQYGIGYRFKINNEF